MSKFNRIAHAWTREEDSLLFEAMEYTGSMKRKAWDFMRLHGSHRTMNAVENRARMLMSRNSLAVIGFKGWGHV